MLRPVAGGMVRARVCRLSFCGNSVHLADTWSGRLRTVVGLFFHGECVSYVLNAYGRSSTEAVISKSGGRELVFTSW